MHWGRRSLQSPPPQDSGRILYSHESSIMHYHKKKAPPGGLSHSNHTHLSYFGLDGIAAPPPLREVGSSDEPSSTATWLTAVATVPATAR